MDFEKYRIKRGFTKALICEKPKAPDVECFKTKAEFDQAEEKFKADVAEYFRKHDEYTKKVNAWRAEKSSLEREFKRDLLEELGLAGNPKADLLFSRAWEYGHSAGYQEVFYYAEELADLIR